MQATPTAPAVPQREADPDEYLKQGLAAMLKDAKTEDIVRIIALIAASKGPRPVAPQAQENASDEDEDGRSEGAFHGDPHSIT